MPTYEYACRECGERLEAVQSFTDDALTVCGSCGGTLRKVFSAAGIIFRGSGYYVNDTRGKGGKNPDAAPAEVSSSGGDSASSSTDGASKDSSSTSSDSASSSTKSSKPDKPSTSGGSGSSSEAKSA